MSRSTDPGALVVVNEIVEVSRKSRLQHLPHIFKISKIHKGKGSNLLEGSTDGGVVDLQFREESFRSETS